LDVIALRVAVLSIDLGFRHRLLPVALGCQQMSMNNLLSTSVERIGSILFTC
jgi:hypothetical protein